MATLRNPNLNFPVISFATIIVTGMLLLFNYNLSRVYIPVKIIDRPPPVYIENVKTPEPVKIDEPNVITLEPLAPINIKTSTNKTNTPAIITPTPLPHGNMDNLDNINIPKFGTGEIFIAPNVPQYFTPDQVEQRPRVLKPVVPVYPYQATVNGVEGRVVLRFIVDENGKVRNPEVVKAEPKGVFEEAALAAIIKYKFIPATIGKRKVKCIAIMPVGFKIN